MISRVVITGRMRNNDTIPVEQIIGAFDDKSSEQVQLILAGNGMYDADSCLAIVELVEDQHKRTGKPVKTHLLASTGLLDFFVWLRCGINGRTMRSTARILVKLPDWCRFSSVECGQEKIAEAERNLELMSILESINEYIPLADYEDKYLNLLNLDEYGLLEESYLHLMEQKNYGVA